MTKALIILTVFVYLHLDTFNSINNIRWGQNCQKCPAGTYNDKLGKGECKPCAVGHQNDIKGATSCKECPVGTYADTVKTIACKKCQAGTYANTDGNTKCKSCKKGTYQDTNGETKCKRCPVRTYNPSTGANELSDCLSCTKGNYCNSLGLTTPIDCPSGTYQDATKQSKCKKCQVGTFNKQAEQTKCALCPEGYYGVTKGGKTLNSACKKCKKGTQNNNKGEDDCTPCPKNTYADVNGLTVCKPCAKNYFTSNTGNTHCVACPKGSIGYSIDSVIVKKAEDVNAVTKMFCDYNLCYRGSKDGFNNKKFHKKCSDVSPSITLVKSTTGQIVGGQTDDTWDNKGWQSSDKAFLFSMTNKAKFNIRNNINKKQATYSHNNYGPTFGAGFDLQTNLNGKQGHTNFGQSYNSGSLKQGAQNTKKLLFGSYKYKISDVEVFGVTCTTTK